jgi:ribosome-associated toxin RatA of RatAB toxin-antitoxin module
MTKISMSTDLDVSADQVWQLVGNFNALPDWHPEVEKSELTKKGQERRLSLVGGGTVVERLEKIDDKARTYSYSIVDSPLPIKNYKATIKVTGTGKGCKLEWSSEFEPNAGFENDVMKDLQGLYQSGFDNLKKMFGG